MWNYKNAQRLYDLQEDPAEHEIMDVEQVERVYDIEKEEREEKEHIKMIEKICEKISPKEMNDFVLDNLPNCEFF